MAERQLLKCSKCGEAKRADEMARSTQRAGGLSSWCKPCKRAVNRAWYQRNKDEIRDGLRVNYEANRPGRLQQMRTYRAENGELLKRAHRRWHLRTRFGLDESEFEHLLVRQNGCCAICRKPETAVDARSGKVRRLAIDHDHETGKVRGLLCFRCNTVLAHIDMDRERLLEMLRYLEGGE